MLRNVAFVRIGELGITLAVTNNWKRAAVFPVKDELGFYIPEYDILHGHRRENFKSYISLDDGLTDHRSLDNCWLWLHSHRRETLKSYIVLTGWAL
jgi:hypothetical protein